MEKLMQIFSDRLEELKKCGKKYHLLHWQCFESKNTNIFCDGHGYDKDEKSFLTVLVISASQNHVRYEYLTRRADLPHAICGFQITKVALMLYGKRVWMEYK